MPPIALLVMDFQTAIRGFAPNPAEFDAAAQEAASLLAVARSLGPEKVLVVHVIGGGAQRTNEELYSVNTDSKISRMFKSLEAEGVDLGIVDTCKPLPSEPVLSRPRVSPFHDSPLPSLLRQHNITDLLLTGVSTSGVVLATFRSAVDADYNVSVVREACMDRDGALHEALMGGFFGRMGSVVRVEEARKLLGV